MTNFAEEAGQKCLQDLAESQAMAEVLNKTIDFIRSRERYLSKEQDASISRVISLMFDIIQKDWANLAMFSPAHRECQDLARNKLKDWFEKEDSNVMDRLGCSGAYYSADEEKFRKQVLEALPRNWE